MAKQRAKSAAARRRICAYHEAGHAVARRHVGAPATVIEIYPSGGGYTHPSPRDRWPGRGQERMWTWLLVLLAGSYVQAFVSRRPFDRVLETSGKLDLREAIPAIRWLVDRGHAKTPAEVFVRNHVATCWFLALRWQSIERVASELQRRGRLTGRQVRALANLRASS